MKNFHSSNLPPRTPVTESPRKKRKERMLIRAALDSVNSDVDDDDDDDDVIFA